MSLSLFTISSAFLCVIFSPVNALPIPVSLGGALDILQCVFHGIPSEILYTMEFLREWRGVPGYNSTLVWSFMEYKRFPWHTSLYSGFQMDGQIAGEPSDHELAIFFIFKLAVGGERLWLHPVCSGSLQFHAKSSYNHRHSRLSHNIVVAHTTHPDDPMNIFVGLAVIGAVLVGSIAYFRPRQSIARSRCPAEGNGSSIIVYCVYCLRRFAV